jgi:monofunctional biosynthetic peptidoglycan transglycosylase
VIRWLVRRVLRLVVSFLIALVAVVALGRVVDPPLTTLMAIRAVEAWSAGRPVRLDRRWVDLDAISPALVRAVLAAEDARFFTHHGVDLEALRRARDFNERQGGRRLRGASTITMQCARSVFLWPSRSYARKAVEIPLAVLLEPLWGKRRVLEVYLNVVEWGDGIYGAQAAAQAAFGVPASRVGPAQAALLAAVLPGPHRWNAATPTAYVRSRAATIATRAGDVSLAPLRN